MPLKRFGYPLWIALLAVLALLHGIHLSADFPNFSPWQDWSKYTDEGWYGNAAIRAHLFGNWYVPGDFNPAPAVPIWPFLEWLLFFLTGVSIQAARGLAVAFFLANLVLAYKLFRERGPRWAGLLAVTLLVSSPFLYSFSRLAILEPLLLCLTLGAMNLALRLPRYRHQEGVAAILGLLFTLMMLTKTTALFLLPALIWILIVPFRRQKRRLSRLLAAAGGAAALSFSLWMLLVVSYDLFADYKYLFFINTYNKPHGAYARFMSFWWSFHGGLWADLVLVPLAGMLVLGALYAWRRDWTNSLWRDPLFGASVLGVAGYIGFMTYQNHPQPRYYVIVAFFTFFVLVRITAQMLYQEAPQDVPGAVARQLPIRRAGLAILALLVLTAAYNSFRTLNYALRPQYTFVVAAQNLTRYIDTHPNGKRLLVSISGDQITLITHLPSLCDDFGTEELSTKMAQYQPGWYATWNEFDAGTLEDIHTRYNLEQVASFPAFDDPERNELFLFKLHPLPESEIRTPSPALRVALPTDVLTIPVNDEP